MNIAIVDYGLGNIFSVVEALKTIGFQARLDTDGSQIRGCAIAVIPGVAAFGAGMSNLAASGQASAIQDHARAGGDIVGFCLGAQMLLDSSEETAGVSGLGLVPGTSIALHRSQCRVPNQGWVATVPADGSTTAWRLESTPHYYYSHSFAMVVGAGVEQVAFGMTGSAQFLAHYRYGNIQGFQFHPERSGPLGLALLAKILTTKE